METVEEDSFCRERDVQGQHGSREGGESSGEVVRCNVPVIRDGREFAISLRRIRALRQVQVQIRTEFEGRSMQ